MRKIDKRLARRIDIYSSLVGSAAILGLLILGQSFGSTAILTVILSASAYAGGWVGRDLDE